MNGRFLLSNLPRVLLRRELRFEFDRAPLVARGLSAKKAANLFAIGLNRVLGLRRATGWPYMAHVAPAGVCNLSCGLCPVRDPEMKGRAILPFDTFRKLVDEAGERLVYIIFWSWGEPLLNPDLERMVRYAADRRILTVTSSNMDRLAPGREDRLVASGLDLLIAALDGVDEETQARLRPGSSAARVVENVRRVMAARERSGGRTPFVNLRMVVSRENESQVEAFRALGRELRVDMVSFKAFSTRQPGYRDPENDRRYAPRDESWRWYGYDEDFAPDRRFERYPCRFPWTKPMLFADGTVGACEFDLRHDHPFGNLGERSFRDIWFGPEARRFRRAFRRDRDAIAFCRDCVFDYKRIPGCVVSREILAP